MNEVYSTKARFAGNKPLGLFRIKLFSCSQRVKITFYSLNTTDLVARATLGT